MQPDNMRNAVQFQDLRMANAERPDMTPAEIDEDVMKSAREFEATFITQVLIHSGLSKALTLNGGEAVEAFSNFYLEEISEQIANQGGFGLADKIYEKMLDAQISDAGNNDGEGNAEIGRL